MSIKYEALTAAIYMARQQLAGVTDEDVRIRASALYPDWSAGAHAAGESCNAGGQTWECYQAHDNAVYPDIAPGNAAWYTFWRPLHGNSIATARAWVQPTGAHDIYRAGEYMIWTDGQVYKCLSDTAYSPGEYAQAWEVK